MQLGNHKALGPASSRHGRRLVRLLPEPSVCQTTPIRQSPVPLGVGHIVSWDIADLALQLRRAGHVECGFDGVDPVVTRYLLGECAAVVLEDDEVA